MHSQFPKFIFYNESSYHVCAGAQPFSAGPEVPRHPPDLSPATPPGTLQTADWVSLSSAAKLETEPSSSCPL